MSMCVLLIATLGGGVVCSDVWLKSNGQKRKRIFHTEWGAKARLVYRRLLISVFNLLVCLFVCLFVFNSF